jgi:hypothetical protein
MLEDATCTIEQAHLILQEVCIQVGATARQRFEDCGGVFCYVEASRLIEEHPDGTKVDVGSSPVWMKLDKSSYCLKPRETL